MGKGLGITGFVISLISLIFILIFPILGLILSIISLVFCIIQLRKEKTGLAIAGLIISIISIIFNVLALIAVIIVWTTVQNTLNSQSEKLNDLAKNIGK